MAGKVIRLAADGAYDFRGEASVAGWLSEKLNGKREVLCAAGRVDVLTDTHAVECKFMLYGPVWAQALGQALMYAEATGKEPAVAGFVEGEIPRAVLKYADVFVMPDLSERCAVACLKKEVAEEFALFGGVR